jgi:hypothetical protein
MYRGIADDLQAQAKVVSQVQKKVLWDFQNIQVPVLRILPGQDRKTSHQEIPAQEQIVAVGTHTVARGTNFLRQTSNVYISDTCTEQISECLPEEGQRDRYEGNNDNVC